MFDYRPMMTEHVGRFTVGFVGIGREKAHSLGSGTLARYGNVRGIISCTHVLNALQGEIGLLCFPTRSGEIQSLKLDVSTTDRVIVGNYTHSELGADIAFLRLPDAVMDSLERHASVIDAVRHHKNALAGEPDKGEQRIELVCGVIDEVTTTRIEMNRAVTTFTGLLNVGRVVEVSRGTNDLDVCQFQPTPVDTQPPSSYGGTSGGGMWRLYIEAGEDGAPTLKQARLVGVAFWEKPIAGNMHIVCHG